MRKRFAMWITAIGLVAGPPVQAQAALPGNGVLSGLAIVWHANNMLTIGPGEGYVAGNQWVVTPAHPPFAFAAANIQGGAAPIANTPYYAYACWDTVALAFTVNPVLSTIAPTNDGLGAGIKTSGSDACDAVFLGSVVSDTTASLVPFVRTGEEVTLALVNNNNNVGTCNDSTWYFGGGAVNINLPNTTGTPNSQCWEVDFASIATVGGNTCNGYDASLNQLDLPYPTSASGMLVDWILYNEDYTQEHHLTVPYLIPNPPGPVYLSNTQLDLYVPPAIQLPGAAGIGIYGRYYTHTRVNPILAATANPNVPPASASQQEFYVCIDNTAVPMPLLPPTVTGYAIYRGYVESIGHLTQG